MAWPSPCASKAQAARITDGSSPSAKTIRLLGAACTAPVIFCRKAAEGSSRWRQALAVLVHVLDRPRATPVSIAAWATKGGT
jgi:hypothetical protein